MPHLLRWNTAETSLWPLRPAPAYRADQRPLSGRVKEAPLTELAVSIRPEDAGDEGAITRLHERCFGPGRFARSASLLRERAPSDPAFCFAAFVGTLLVGSVKVSPVLAGSEPALVLGPLAVDPAFEGRGIGAALMRKVIEVAKDHCEGLVLLVGDAPYYERFGFKPIPSGRIALPGPVDPARLLGHELAPGALDRARGRIGPRWTPSA